MVDLSGDGGCHGDLEAAGPEHDPGPTASLDLFD
jgi:hypothetical protein